jgi:hypothetical protein
MGQASFLALDLQTATVDCHLSLLIRLLISEKRKAKSGTVFLSEELPDKDQTQAS